MAILAARSLHHPTLYARFVEGLFTIMQTVVFLRFRKRVVKVWAPRPPAGSKRSAANEDGRGHTFDRPRHCDLNKPQFKINLV